MFRPIYKCSQCGEKLIDDEREYLLPDGYWADFVEDPVKLHSCGNAEHSNVYGMLKVVGFYETLEEN